MKLSGAFLILFTAVLIGLGIMYAVFNLRPSSIETLKAQDGSQSGTLSTPTVVGTAQAVTDAFFNTPGSTIDAYIYVNGRTPNMSSTLIAVGDVLKLKIQAAGPGSNPETVLTVKHADNTNGQNIMCTPFPLQKWVHVTIIREGRRFTVFYNDQVAADERILKPIMTVVSNITLGSEGLPGEWALPNLSPYAYRLEDIRRTMEATSDTRGVPNVSPTISFDFFSCPNGFFCFSADTSQQSTLSPLRRWQTPYA